MGRLQEQNSTHNNLYKAESSGHNRKVEQTNLDYSKGMSNVLHSTIISFGQLLLKKLVLLSLVTRSSNKGHGIWERNNK